MVREVTSEEIKSVLFAFDDNKAPGPDGFNSCFFKRAWGVIGEEVTGAIQRFFQTGLLVRDLNTTLLALIPKVESPKHPSDFRPISCCNVLYKVISKIMANRLCESLGDLIDFSQTAFIPGRRITDNVLLAQELLHGYNRRNLPSRCAFKVDLMKAYDMVEWEFVLAVMEAMGVHPRFLLWVRACLTTPSYSININGVSEGFFQGKRGLRQGDPISPYLFVMVMNVLHGLLQKRIEMTSAFVYHWKCVKTKTFMLSFADDLLLFSNADPISIGVLMEGLKEFGDMSGLRANATKTNWFLSESGSAEILTLQPVAQFPLGTLPVRHLGVPLITSKLTIADCRPLLSKVEERIGSWTNKMLTYAGRVQLIKSVLASLHMYWASIFILPKGILRAIEAKLRRFLWCGSA